MKFNKLVMGIMIITFIGFIVFVGISSVVMLKGPSNGNVKDDKKILADAVILEVEYTGLIVENRTELRLLLEVHPYNSEPFRIWVKEAVYSPDVYLYVRGSKLKVVYDSEAPQKIYLASAPVRK